ncbi:MAG: stage V sporulation protein S [Caldilineaceae bacterium]
MQNPTITSPAERIAEALHNDDNLVLQAIGVKAVYQAVKSISDGAQQSAT